MHAAFEDAVVIGPVGGEKLIFRSFGGLRLEEFLQYFPSVSREMSCRVLERSEAALLSGS